MKWILLRYFTADDGRNLCGTENSLVGLIYKAWGSIKHLKHMAISCIAWAVLCRKHLNVLCVIEAAVNFICSSGFNHQWSVNFCLKWKLYILTYSCYMTAQYLRIGKILLGVFECRAKVKFFLNEKNHSQPLLLKTEEWLWKLAFAEDLKRLLVKVSLILQGENSAYSETCTWVKLFWQLLMLNHKMLLYTLCCCKLQEAKYPFP